MRKFLYILPFLLSAAACSNPEPVPTPEPPGTGISIRLGQNGFSTRVVDEDNLASEQVVNDISVFFTDPSSDDILYKYVNAGFRTSGDYRVVTIPLEPAQLQTKDIYVITNYGDDAALEALNTVTELSALRTPVISKSDNLEAGEGFCMYGMTAGFDFTDDSLGSPLVNVERTCAKIRITLSFPGNPRLSPTNTFLIAHAASYTYVTEGTHPALTASEYFNFASETEFESFGTAYRGTAYVYEASEAPVMYLYTHINSSVETQEFSADLPVPERNYLYDIDARVYEDLAPTRSGGAGYRMVTTVTAYGPDGVVRYETTDSASGCF